MLSQEPSWNFFNKIWMIVLIILGMVFTWLIITRSFVAYFAQSSPETALNLRSNDAVALINIADKILPPKNAKAKALEQNSAENKRQDRALSELEKMAKQAVKDSPLNARAFRVLGQISEKNNKIERAKKYMETAVRFSKREDIATYWLMNDAYKKENYTLTLDYVEILLAHRPFFIKHIMPMLTVIAEHKNKNQILEARLAKNPIWRLTFFESLPYSITRFDTPLTILTNLKKTSAPPTKQELKPYFRFLLGKKRYEQAYYSWLQFLSNEELESANFLFNGNFDMPLDGMPFNWVVQKGTGTRLNIIADPDRIKKKLLQVLFRHGRSNFKGMSQIIMLSPGHYGLQGHHKGQLIGRRGLRWEITCLDKATSVVKSAMFIGRHPKWEAFETAFTIPEKSCTAQRLRLMLDARTDSEKLVSGKVSYKSLKIIRKTDNRL